MKFSSTAQASVPHAEKVDGNWLRTFLRGVGGRENLASRRLRAGAVLAAVLLGSVPTGWAATYTVTSTADTGDAGTLRWAIDQANANAGSTINIANNLGTITLGSSLQIITQAVTINGGTGNSISGNNLYRIFFVDTASSTAAVNISNINLIDGRAQGGAGGSGGGGGGLGAGGAIFVNSGAVSVQRVNFANNSAIGGAGGFGGAGVGATQSGGGGGLGGAGGNGSYTTAAGGGGYGGAGGSTSGGSSAGGGGLIGNGGNGAPHSLVVQGAGGGGGLTNGSPGSQTDGGTPGTGGGKGGDPTNYGGPYAGGDGSLYGGGGGGTGDNKGGNGGKFGGGGGGGALGYYNALGGNGGDFGGGGGVAGAAGVNTSAGNGGWGGGGGGGPIATPGLTSGLGGGGGFGGGGGGDYGHGVSGGYLGGSSAFVEVHPRELYSISGGGGGGAAGGAIFVRSGTGGSLTIIDSDLDQGSVVGGAGGLGGSAGTTASGSGTGAGSALFLDGGTTTLRSTGGTHTIFGDIADAAPGGYVAASLAITGSGILVLAGNNTYTGTTILSSGTLGLGSAGAIGTSGTIIFGGGTLQFSASNTSDYSGRFSNAVNQAYRLDTNGQNVTLASTLSSVGGSLTKLGAGTLTLRGGNTFSGALNASSGTLTISGGGSVTNNATSFVGNTTGETGTLIVTGSDSRLNMGADLVVGYAGSGNLIISDGGYVQNTYTQVGGVGKGNILVTGTGSRWVNTAGLVLGNQGVAMLTISSGGYVTSTDSHIGRSSSALVTGPGSRWDASWLELGQSGVGDLTITDGGLVSTSTVDVASVAGSVGTISLSGGGMLSATKLTEGAGSSTIALDGGVLQAKEDESDFISNFEAGDVTIGEDGAFIDSGSHAIGIKAQLSGIGALIKQGLGTLTLSGSNTYGGGTVVDEGTVVLANASALGTGSLTVNDGTLDLNGQDITVSALIGANTSSVISNSAAGGSTFTSNQNGHTTYAGTIRNGAGTLSLVKQGLGTLTLTGANTYTGTTTVSGGALRLENTFQSPAFSIASGSVLELYTASGSRDFSSTVFSGGGTLVKIGVGTAKWDSTSAVFQMGAGSLIDVREGLLVGGSFANEDWTNNKSDLNVVAGAEFNGAEANVRVDALTGSGTIRSGADGAGYESFTFGVDNGSGTFDGVLANNAPFAGNYVKAGSGTQILTGANTYTGTTTVSGGTLQIGSGGTSGSLASATIVNNASLAFNRSNAITYAGTISGTGSLTKAGAGTLTLIGANTYTGVTTVSGGILQIGGGGTTGSLASAAIVNNASLAFDRSNASTYAGTISGTGSVTKAGAGTLTVTGASTYTGATMVNGGALRLENTTQSPAFAIASGAKLELYIASDSRVFGSTVYSGGGELVKTGAGTVRWDQGSAVFQMAGGSLIDVREGLFVGGSNANEVWTNNKADLNVMAGAEFNGAEANVRVDALTGSGTIRSGSNGFGYENFTFGVDNGSGTFDGILANNAPFAGNYVKAGSGTQTLTGASTYTGSMTIAGGTLQIGNGGTTGSIIGNTINNGSLVFNRSGILSYGGVVSGTGSLAKTGSGRLTLSGANTYSGGTAITGGTLAIASDANLGGASGAVSISGGTLQTTERIDTARTFTLGSGGGTFDVAGSALVLRSNLTGAGGLTKKGTGLLTLTGAQGYTGATVIEAGTVQFDGGGNQIATASIAIGSEAALGFVGSQEYAGTVTGSGNLLRQFAGTTILSGDVSAGSTVILGGTIQIGNGGTTGTLTGPVLIGEGASLAFNRAGTLAIAGISPTTPEQARSVSWAPARPSSPATILIVAALVCSTASCPLAVIRG